jgi:hypothetical protein
MAAIDMKQIDGTVLYIVKRLGKRLSEQRTEALVRLIP